MYDLFCSHAVTVTVHAVPIHVGSVTVHAVALDMLLETAVSAFTVECPAVSEA